MIIFNHEKLKNVKQIVLNKIDIHTTSFDAFIKDDVQNILKFELEKNGYQIITNINKDKLITTVTNLTIQTNNSAKKQGLSLINLTIMHRRYYKDIDEIDNITFSCDIYSESSSEKLCSILYSETDNENLLNTQYLQKMISRMIKMIKKMS